MDWFRSLSRHLPKALKFSKARPRGSIRLWHEPHKRLLRWTLSVSFSVGGLPLMVAATCSIDGIFGGGGGGGVPKRLSRINKPRFTGEVLSGFDVTTRNVPCVRTPPRGLSDGNVTFL